MTAGSVTTWNDIIQNADLTSNGTTNLLKTVGTEGIVFGLYDTRSRRARNSTKANIGSNAVIAMILNTDAMSATYGNILTLTNNSGGWYYNYRGSGGATSFKFQHTPSTSSDLTDNYAATGLQDIVIVRSNNAGSIVKSHCYTNGQYSATVNHPSGAFDPAQLCAVGGDFDGNLHQGRILEIQIYTNMNDWRNWASNFHYYRTNTYGGTP